MENTYLVPVFCHCNNLVDVTVGVYTEGTLRAFVINQIIDFFLKIQEQANIMIASLTAELPKVGVIFFCC